MNKKDAQKIIVKNTRAKNNKNVISIIIIKEIKDQ